ncbi:macrocin O-methyltransferase [bacterium (Candidatus Blackallbacteria) CG17_big_fil_post_rev_8_21_14_2_50_48_46]|uniref:Macrocin O-methyltransferase n=1 Tax=bacterium (Candidatus Blackallbacteria) CG17_big_fil_post_rev_8_21_14_2_50_48_46 TaxID=2014261 RepID=A0A2M7GBJ3_9BACT|nr:MAG: macrocin O-methyltransferase [bacterium (Candidatus Blackallbacteria) CG18_big_fil_WC_8_21_14_2_50_49_26]PIW19562.1 MAG: macrocin O-methyltransferase [bacterium (Candidatus Blackallbacteria) CG17_big_fil_post_rev_8_21_14_2_50_48_46]PIW48835.1 MAG: macrocin O-methyltransferase [bacterium (Candidatus Blackallbacteria) CG13_big_fil_rev_8_21_14_2_50_49_14]
MQESHLRQLYLELLKKVLGDFIYDLDATGSEKPPPLTWADPRTGRKYTLQTMAEYKYNGLIFPRQAHTMIGMKRLNNLQYCVEEALKQNIPGDLLEAGVWKGGACILMRALLKAYGINNRKVWVADSFAGFLPEDLKTSGLDPTSTNQNSISQEKVKAHFKAYDLLDDQVCFLPGYFHETLPEAPVEKLAVLRLDADFYNPTQEILTHLYPRLSPGGFIIIDDYHIFEECRQAVLDYRQTHQIKEPIHRIDPAAVYWQKKKENLTEPLLLEKADL